MIIPKLTQMLKRRLSELDTEALVRFAALATISEVAWAFTRGLLLLVLGGH